tara:strand:- start:57 stop:227 length:171 start_codon:yes stop_codon:yes gene_type:complete
VVTLTDALNQVQEHRSFDAFGKPRYGGMVEGNGTLTSLIQGAPFIHAPANSQSHNP